MPELLGRGGIGLPSVGAKARAYGRVCSRLYMYCAILVTTGK